MENKNPIKRLNLCRLVLLSISMVLLFLFFSCSTIFYIPKTYLKNPDEGTYRYIVPRIKRVTETEMIEFPENINTVGLTEDNAVYIGLAEFQSMSYVNPVADGTDIYRDGNTLYYYFETYDPTDFINKTHYRCFYIDLTLEKAGSQYFYDSSIYNEHKRGKIPIEMITIHHQKKNKQLHYEALSLSPYIYVDLTFSDKYGVDLSFLFIDCKSETQLASIISEEVLYMDGYHILTGYDREGFDRSGYNAEGYARHGFDRSGRDREGNRFSGRITEAGMEGYGTLFYADGGSFRGWFSKNSRQGPGVYLDADGSWYAGYFSADAKSGRGVQFTPGSGAVLEEWTNGQRRIVSQQAGRIVEPYGSWAFLGGSNRGGYAEGRGEAISLEDDSLILGGEFENGSLIKGKLTTGSGEVYEGSFRGGVLVDGAVRFQNGDRYLGTLQDQKPHGSGTYYFRNGGTYTGTFVDGRFEGEGKLVKANGETYEGPFVNGVPHGVGFYTFGDVAERCEYRDGKRIDQVYLMRLERQKLERQLEEERRLREEEADQREAERIAAEEREAERREREREKEPVKVEKNQWALDALEDIEDLRESHGLTGENPIYAPPKYPDTSEPEREEPSTERVVRTTDSTPPRSSSTESDFSPYTTGSGGGPSQGGRDTGMSSTTDSGSAYAERVVKDETTAEALQGTESITNTPDDEIASSSGPQYTYTIFNVEIDTGDYFAGGRSSRKEAISSGKEKALNKLRERVWNANYRLDADEVVYTIQHDYQQETVYGDEWFVKIYAEVEAYIKSE